LDTIKKEVEGINKDLTSMKDKVEVEKTLNDMVTLVNDLTI